MHGISIDDRPDNPVGTTALRRTIAIHWNWTTEYTTKEIARALGVRPQTVRKYLSEGPTEDVRALMNDVEAEVRMVAVAELKDQLKRAGHESRSAEAPVKIWQDDNGDILIGEPRDDSGNIVERYPIPDDFEIGPDTTERYYRRTEVREIIEQLAELTGAGEPEQHEVTGAGGGPLQIEISNTVIQTDEHGSE